MIIRLLNLFLFLTLSLQGCGPKIAVESKPAALPIPTIVAMIISKKSTNEIKVYVEDHPSSVNEYMSADSYLPYQTPLIAAVFSERHDLIEMLLSHGADIEYSLAVLSRDPLARRPHRILSSFTAGESEDIRGNSVPP